ncbi:hypothetical protein HY636_06280 [Candidatus Woesearchaeota archaeon]|nr:hypothetical protein [Candidatus Woesearchaeota archaeon]
MTTEPYKIQATIIPTNETGGNLAKFIVSCLAFGVSGRADDEYSCVGYYLRLQDSWCREVIAAGGSIADYFEKELSSRYHSIKELEKEVSGGDREVNLTKLCEVHLPQEQHSYLPGNTIVEFYKII